ncbi:uncharacterized protein B0P05DRAFT_523059 [Gilbertella persicaria]|uniref:Ricin B lectin domain-containing protein n=1 Tax=Rhizopus stolonifer TaxID=4846 RepID=A0A367JRK7_RHIST|nr:uncharacterized protein B0P05DRAFT_523059 [Gilbertella persicaria]KAI8098034.1 hypothetical protein B0P05DRAFT_523059 [Gilbertella persicaria]RCH92546.1 hypothetical protein CU098_007911 [Rhizopus stolonifer]
MANLDEFPVGWFYIQCPTRQNQVLTVANMTMQPLTRVELRPKRDEKHQLWCYHEGHLVNKYSGCVLGVEKQKISDATVYQIRRPNDNKPLWQYKDKQLVFLQDYALNDLAVPRLVEKQNGCIYQLLSADF